MTILLKYCCVFLLLQTFATDWNYLANYLNTGGVVLLGPYAFLKSKLVNQLNTNKIAYNVMIYGDGGNKIDCESLAINANNIYLYARNIGSNSFCEQSDSIFIEIANRIQLPLIIDLFFDNSKHFEIFGNIADLRIDKVSTELQKLPVGSTIISGVNFNAMTLQSSDDELVLNAFKPFIGNPYLRFIFLIVSNPDNNLFLINTKKGVKSFQTNINKLSSLETDEILNLQIIQISNFIAYCEENIDFHYKKEKAFKSFIANHLDNFLDIEWLRTNTNIVRYKELLLFNLIKENKTTRAIDILNNDISYIEAKSLYGDTPIKFATFFNNMKLVTKLIRLGAIVDQPNDFGVTAIMIASKKNYLETTKLLLNSGKVDINTLNIQGESPLSLTYSEHNLRIIDLFCNFTQLETQQCKEMEYIQNHEDLEIEPIFRPA